MQKHVIWGVCGLVIGFVSGGYLAYRSLSKVYKKKLKEAEDLYLSGDEDEDLEDVDWSDPFDEDEDSEEEINPVQDYVKLSREYDSPAFNEHFAQRVGPKDDDNEYDPDDIYEITQEQFKKEIGYRDNETLTYYKKDGVLVDCCEHVLRDKVRVIGQEALDTLEAEDISDIDFVYVSNDVDDKVFEIVIEHNYSWEEMNQG